MDDETLKKMREGNGLFTNGATPLDLGRLSRWWDRLRGTPPAGLEAKPDYKPKHEMVKDIGSVGINVTHHETGGTQGGERKLPGELVDFYMTQLDKMVVGMHDMIIKRYNHGGVFPSPDDRWRAAGMTDATGVIDPNFLVETNLFDLVTNDQGEMDKEKIKKLLTSGAGNRDHFIKLIQTHIDQDTSRLFSRIGTRQSLNPNIIRNYVDHSRLFLNLDRGTANQLLVDALKSALEQITTRGGRKFRPTSAGYVTIVAALLATPLMAFVGASAAAGLAATLGVAYGASLGAALGTSAAAILNAVGVTSLTAGGAVIGGGLVPLLASLRSSIFRQGVTVNNTSVGQGLQGLMTQNIFNNPGQRAREEEYLQDMHGVDMSAASLANMTPQRTILERGMIAVVGRLMYRQAVLGEKQGSADAMLDDGILLAHPGEPVRLEQANLTMNKDIIELFRVEYARIAAARPPLDVNAINLFPNINQDEHRAAMLEALRIARGRYAVNEAQELHLEVIKIESGVEKSMADNLKKKLEGAASPDVYQQDGSINVEDMVDGLGRLRTSADIDAQSEETRKKKLKSLGLFRECAAAIAAALVPPGPNPIEAYQYYRRQRESVFIKSDKKVLDDLRQLETAGNKPPKALDIERQLFGAPNRDQNEVISRLQAVINGNDAMTGVAFPAVVGAVGTMDIAGVTIDGSIAYMTRVRAELLTGGLGRSILQINTELGTNANNLSTANITKTTYENVVTQANERLADLSRRITAGGAAALTPAEHLEMTSLRTWIANPAIGGIPNSTINATIPRADYFTALNTIQTLTRQKNTLDSELAVVTARRDAYRNGTDAQMMAVKAEAARLLTDYNAALTGNTATEETKRIGEFTTECRAAFAELTNAAYPGRLNRGDFIVGTFDDLMVLARDNGAIPPIMRFWTEAEENKPENRTKLQRARIWDRALANAAVARGAIPPRAVPDNTDIRQAVEQESVSLDASISTQHTRLMDARRGVEANRAVITTAQDVNERRKVVSDSNREIVDLAHDFTQPRETNLATIYDVTYNAAVTPVETAFNSGPPRVPPIYFTLLNYIVGYQSRPGETGVDLTRRARAFTAASTIYGPDEMRNLLCRLPLLAPIVAQPFNAVAIQLGVYLRSGQIVDTDLRRELRNRANQQVYAAINI
ncbi:MAG: hypothetical protein WCO78_00920 [Candidatus Roizmanbacteria bacterium]